MSAPTSGPGPGEVIEGQSEHDLEHEMWGGVWTAFAFEVPDPGGEPNAADPDGIVKRAAWLPMT